MDTLLLRLCGPLQSWGVQSLYENRDSSLEPSKSGVIGILCAALGKPRSAPLDDLAALKMGVRVDREGIQSMDHHTAQTISLQGRVEFTNVTRRHYLADAVFLVGLEGRGDLLECLHQALHQPRWGLFLGRKAFLPGKPVWLQDGLRPGQGLREALLTYPWLCAEPSRPADVRPLRVVFEDPTGQDSRPDVPINFELRQFTTRRVRTEFIPCPA